MEARKGNLETLARPTNDTQEITAENERDLRALSRQNTNICKHMLLTVEAIKLSKQLPKYVGTYSAVYLRYCSTGIPVHVYSS